MNSLQILGMRSLTNTGEIRIAPITILLGTNSSGKSTFLRTLPLLRQTVEVRTSEPLLWYGRLVDFGSFEEAVSSHSKEKAIAIKINYKISGDFSVSGHHPYQAYEYQAPRPVDCNLEFEIKETPQTSENQKTRKIPSFISQIQLSLLDTKIEINFSEPFVISGAFIDEIDVTDLIRATYLATPSQTVIPTVFTYQNDFGEENEASGPQPANTHQKLLQIVQGLVHGRTKVESVEQLIQSLRLGSTDEILQQIKEIQLRRGIWKRSISSWTNKTSELLEIRKLLWCARLEELLDAASRDLRREFLSISYITPLRAAAERYYRQQGLATNELDSKGENFAEYLRSLLPREREELRRWLGSALGIYVDLEESKGHVSLYLIDEKTRSKVNLADTGFGYSQLLPIAVQLWALQSERKSQTLRSTQPRILAIEQPELHLHPRVQAKVADLLANTTGDQMRRKTSIIIETHSEALVNRLGKLIEEGKLKEESVNIVLFNKTGFSEPTSVFETGFDSKGVLRDWPLGFFNAD